MASIYLSSKVYIDGAIKAGQVFAEVAQSLVKRMKLPPVAAVGFETSNRTVEHFTGRSARDSALAWSQSVQQAFSAGAWETAAYAIGFGLHSALFSSLPLSHGYQAEDALLALRQKTLAGYIYAAAPLQLALKLGKPLQPDYGGASLDLDQLGRLEGSLLMRP